MSTVESSDIRTGLLSSQKYASELLQWITQDGQELFKERQKQIDLYSRETDAICKGMRQLSSRLSDRVVIIDLGAGKTKKAVSMMESLVEGKPDRKLAYVPIDCSDVVKEWPEYLSEYPEFEKHVTSVVPLVGDMIHLMSNLGTMMSKHGLSDYEPIFVTFGPNTMLLSLEYFITLTESVAQYVQKNGKGYWFYTYVPWTEHTCKRMREAVYDRINTAGIMQCVLKGLNEAAGGDIDISKFTHQEEFLDSVSSPEGDSVAGWAIYGVAKETHSVYFDKLDLHITFQSGERIRCSDDGVKSHFLPQKYLTDMSDKRGLTLVDTTSDNTGLIDSIWFTLK